MAIDKCERSLAKEFFRRDQKVGETDEDYARSLKLLAERAFKGCPQPKLPAGWLSSSEMESNRQASPRNSAQLRPTISIGTSGDVYLPDVPSTANSATCPLDSSTPDPKSSSRPVRRIPLSFPPGLFHKISTRSSPIKLLSAEGRKMKAIGETSLKITIGKEIWTVQFIMCPELVCDAILGVNFLRNTGAILNFAEGTFTTQQHKAVKSAEPSLGKDTDEICSALFEAAGIPVNKLDELCSRLTHITDSERKELHSL
ncbi:unnamed protein product, partial [Taenia asiatica]